MTEKERMTAVLKAEGIEFEEEADRVTFRTEFWAVAQYFDKEGNPVASTQKLVLPKEKP